MAAHRYWRVRVATTNGDAFARVGELQLRESTGGPNHAVSGAPVYSSQFASSGDNSSFAAFDGNPATAWAAGDATRAIGYDLGATEVLDVQEVAITARNDGFGPAGAPQDGAIEWSDDGAAWTAYFTFAGQVGWAAGETRAFAKAGAPAYVAPATGHRYWRVNVTATNGDATVRIGELRMREIVGGVSSAVGGAQIFSAQASGVGDNSAAAALDADIATSWGASPVPQYLGYDFGAGVAPMIAEVDITARNDAFGPIGAPNAFTLDYSDDGAAWTTLWPITTQVGWAAGERRIFTQPIAGLTLDAALPVPLGLGARFDVDRAFAAPSLPVPLGLAGVLDGGRSVVAPALPVPLGLVAAITTGSTFDAPALPLRLGLVSAMENGVIWRRTDLGPDVITPRGVATFAFGRGPEAGLVQDVLYRDQRMTVAANIGDPTRPSVLTATWDRYVVPSGSIGWQSTEGTGIQDPSIVSFNQPVRRIRVSLAEADYFTNYIAAYDRYGFEIARQVLDGPYTGEFGANVDLDVGANLIWSFALVLPLDWATYYNLRVGLQVGDEFSEWFVADPAPDSAWTPDAAPPATDWSATNG